MVPKFTFQIIFFFPFQCNSSIVECSDQFIYMTFSFRFGLLGELRASYAHRKCLGKKSGLGYD